MEEKNKLENVEIELSADCRRSTVNVLLGTFASRAQGIGAGMVMRDPNIGQAQQDLRWQGQFIGHVAEQFFNSKDGKFSLHKPGVLTIHNLLDQEISGLSKIREEMAKKDVSVAAQIGENIDILLAARDCFVYDGWEEDYKVGIEEEPEEEPSRIIMP